MVEWTRLQWKAWVPLLLWMAVIFSFSAMPSTSTGEYPMSLWFYLERKSAHVFEYFILTILIIRALSTCRTLFQKRSEVVAIAMLAALGYACSDEFHQLFVYGREGKLLDVMVDFIGITLAALVVVLWWRWRVKNFEK